MDEPFPAARFLVRGRRLADLSQRELSELVAAPQSSLAAYESGARQVPLQILVRLLAACGLRLAVIDREGGEVAPYPQDAQRDDAGRRFPAHLDVQPPDQLPRRAVYSPRHDRATPPAWSHRRAERDRLRAQAPDAPLDHPTGADLARRRREQLYGRFSWWNGDAD